MQPRRWTARPQEPDPTQPRRWIVTGALGSLVLLLLRIYLVVRDPRQPGDVQLILPAFVVGFHFPPDGTTLLVATSTEVSAWSWPARQRRFTIPVQVRSAVAWSGDGQWAAFDMPQNTVEIWRLADQQRTAVLPGYRLSQDWARLDLAFNRDGSVLASSRSADQPTLRVWHLHNGVVVGELPTGINSESFLALSADGRLLAVPHIRRQPFEMSTQIWDLEGNHVRQSLPFNPIDWGVGAFSPDGHLLAAEASNHAIELWRIADGTVVTTLPFDETPNAIEALAFSPDGQYLAAGTGSEGAPNYLFIWDVTTSPPTRVKTIRTHYVTGLAFSPDAQVIGMHSFSSSRVDMWQLPRR